jgi:DTW domain-containing protein YfiP
MAPSQPNFDTDPDTDPSYTDAPRPFCYRCHRPERLCLCLTIPRVDHATSVLVIQHYRERRHPIGTARFVELGLARGRVQIHDPRRPWLFPQPPTLLPPRTSLLFPSRHATNIEDLPATERPRCLLVLDGTWSQARGLLRHLPWLHDLPHLAIRSRAQSNYIIRTQPKPGFLATIEAIVLALRALEPDNTALDELLRAFDDMVAAQQHASQRRQPRWQGMPAHTPPRGAAQLTPILR